MKPAASRVSLVIVVGGVVVVAGLLVVFRELSTTRTERSTPRVANQTVLVSVSARRPWTDTGVEVFPGSRVSIFAGGTVYISRDDPGTEPSGPAIYCKQPIRPQAHSSDSSFTAPGLPCWSLIGRIGAGSPFEVGTAKVLSVRSSGRLYLGVNDQIRAFNDNVGNWTATVSVTPT